MSKSNQIPKTFLLSIGRINVVGELQTSFPAEHVNRKIKLNK